MFLKINKQMMFPFSIIVAEEFGTHGIGKNGAIPWSIKQDMNFFKSVTTKHPNSVVIMGRKTMESIPSEHFPLPGRINFVLSKSFGGPGLISMTIQKNANSHSMYIRGFKDIWKYLNEKIVRGKEVGPVFVIGGAQIYNECIKSPWCESVYLTTVKRDTPYDCDVFWDGVNEDHFKEDLSFYMNYTTKDGEQVMTRKYVNKLGLPSHPEKVYLDSLQHILDHGEVRNDRTGTGTLSVFGLQTRYDLSQGFPLFTTKRVYWKGVVEELVWFIKGDTNSQSLSQKGVHIWDENGAREFLDKRGLQHHEEGDLGPVYGFQWRHFGAHYKGPKSKGHDYENKGIDQLRQCIDQIKKDPFSRRIIMSAWNVSDLDDMALPPCHVMCQFYVSFRKDGPKDGPKDEKKPRLSCQLYQRSADMMLGVPFNVASYALLLHVVAKMCDLDVGEFVHTIGDAHIYLNHIDGAKEQLGRKPLVLPSIVLKDGIDIDNFTADDVQLVGYVSHGGIKLKMAV